MRFGEKLIEAGLIDQAQLDAALSHQNQTGQHIGEALLELGYIDEEQYLKFLSREFHTRFVSGKRLSWAKISPKLLELIPFPLAEQRLLFPIRLEMDPKRIGIVSCEPQEEEAIREVQIVSGMKDVDVYVARRDVIRAMIRKHYLGDLHAFEKLEDDLQPGAEDSLEAENQDAKRIVLDLDLAEHDRLPTLEEEIYKKEPHSSKADGGWARALDELRSHEVVSHNDFIQTLAILVGLLEMQVPFRHGHSSSIAKTTKAFSEKLGCSEKEIHHHLLAAYLHDLGKRPSIHLTAFTTKISQEHRMLAARYHLTPIRLFDQVQLPSPVIDILTHLYEHYDGNGLPDRLQSDRIPLGSRLIATIDSLEDLLTNPNHPLGPQRPLPQALDLIRGESGRCFDPMVVSLLENWFGTRQAQEKVRIERPLLALVDPVGSTKGRFRRQLKAAGFQLEIFQDEKELLNHVQVEKPDALLLVGQGDLNQELAFFTHFSAQAGSVPGYLLVEQAALQIERQASLVGVRTVFEKQTPMETIIKKLGEDLFLEVASTTSPQARPAQAETEQAQTIPEQPLPEAASNIIFTNVTETQHRMLSGSLEQKSALSLIRALAVKKRTGRLTLRKGSRRGILMFESGQVFSANVEDMENEEAFLELAQWREALYRFEPDSFPQHRSIHTSTIKLIQVAELQALEEDEK